MKAIKLNAETRTIEMIDLQKGNDGYLAAMQEAVGGMIEATIRWPGNILYVDEEGAYKPNDTFQFWPESDYGPRVFIGSGIIVGDDGEGGDCEPTLTIEQVEAMRFVDRAEALALCKRFGL